MTTHKEALHIALDALENPNDIDEYNRSKYDLAITVIKEALQSNEQVEPVAWLVQGMRNDKLISHQLFFTLDEARKLASAFVQHYPTVNIKPLYTHPPVPTAQPKEPEQEPNHDKK